MSAPFASLVQQTFHNLTLPPWPVATLVTFSSCLVIAAIVAPSSKPTPVVKREPAECRYRLDNDTSATLELPDGRKLGYAEYGVPTGKAILYCHGLPGSRLEIAFLDKFAVRLSARIIAVDRPGYGWSSPQLDRTVIDHVNDLQYLAEHLELDSYAVLGISGGGPYALACAKFLPADKLKAVSIVCGVGPPDIGYRGMNVLHWLGFTFGWPYLSRPSAWWVGKGPESKLHLSDEERFAQFQHQFSKSKSKAHPKDVAFFDDPDRLRLYLRSSRESYAQGFDALAQDGRLCATAFGFRIEEIRKDLPVQLWYGKLDDFVPLNHGEQIAARIGPSAVLHREDETHASLVLNCDERFLEELVNAVDACEA